MTSYSHPCNAIQLCKYGGHGLFTITVEYVPNAYIKTEVCCQHYLAQSLKTDGEGFYLITMFNLFTGVSTVASLAHHEL